MRVIELDEGTIPHKDFAIYPDLGIKCVKIQNHFESRFTGVYKYVYVIKSSFHVKINRNGADYLIPCAYQLEFPREIDLMNSINDFVKTSNKIALDIIDYYIVDQNISTSLNNGIDITIYKYKPNKLYAEV